MSGHRTAVYELQAGRLVLVRVTWGATVRAAWRTGVSVARRYHRAQLAVRGVYNAALRGSMSVVWSTYTHARDAVCYVGRFRVVRVRDIGQALAVEGT